MRCTQYIGLNKYAKDWLDKQEIIKTEPKMIPGMFGEDVPLTIYHIKPKDKDCPSPNEKYTAVECISASPWSSGPMIFTYLHVSMIKKDCDFFEKDEDRICEWGEFFHWICDPGLQDEDIEYDYETGRYYV